MTVGSAGLSSRALTTLALLALITTTSCTGSLFANLFNPKKDAAAAVSATDSEKPASALTDTPNVPDKPHATDTQPQSQPGGATVVKTVPAPDSSVHADASPTPPKPEIRTDPQTRAAFEAALVSSRGTDLSNAERQFKLVVQRDPKLDYAWTDLGVVYEREALTAQAEAAYNKAVELNPDQPMAWDYLARLYCRTGRAVKIEATLRTKIADRPASLALRTALIVALVAQNKLESAANEAKKVLKADERHVRAMQLLAQVYAKQRKYELAKMVLENAKAIDPSDPATVNAMGTVQLALEQKQAAFESFRQAVELKPDYAEANNNYGAMLNDTQDYDTAVRVLEAAVNAAPDFVSARLNLGNAYRGQQQFAKAMDQYQQVIRLAPQLADTYYNVAILHLDSEIPNMDPIERYKTAIGFFIQYQNHGGKDDRIEQYLKDANKGIEKEERRREREKKDLLRKAAKDDADRKAAAKAAEEAAASAKAREQQEAAQRRAAAAKLGEGDAPAQPRRSTSGPAQASTPAPAHSAGSKLGDDDPAPVPATPPSQGPARPASGKLGDSEK